MNGKQPGYASSINILAVTDAYNFNDQPVFKNFINHALIPNTNTITEFRADQFLDAVWKWFIG